MSERINWRKWKGVIIFLSVIVALMLLSGPGCGRQWMLFYDKPIKGYVVDAETGKPLEGVIIVGMWRLSQYFSAGFGGYAKVTVVTTDKDGKFRLPVWVALKPWTFYSHMHDLAPEIAVYKPGYKFKWSHMIMREGFPGDDSKTAEEKKELKEEYSLNPTKLTKIFSDEDRIQNYNDWSTFARFPGPQFPLNYFSRNEITFIYSALAEEFSHLPREKAAKYYLGK